MTISGTRVGKRFSCFGHKLPLITGWMQCQFEDPKGVNIADLAVCCDCSQRGAIRSTTAYNEFPIPTGCINVRLGV